MQKTTRNCGDPVPGVACYVARVAKSGAQVGTGDDTDQREIVSTKVSTVMTTISRTHKGIRGWVLSNFAKEDSSIVANERRNERQRMERKDGRSCGEKVTWMISARALEAKTIANVRGARKDFMVVCG